MECPLYMMEEPWKYDDPIESVSQILAESSAAIETGSESLTPCDNGLLIFLYSPLHGFPCKRHVKLNQPLNNLVSSV